MLTTTVKWHFVQATVINLIINHLNTIKMDLKHELAKELDKYIKEKHTQEECTGFISGFEKAIEVIMSPYICLHCKEIYNEIRENGMCECSCTSFQKTHISNRK